MNDRHSGDNGDNARNGSVKRRVFLSGAGAAALSAILAACGGTDVPTATTATGSGASTSGATKAAPTTGAAPTTANVGTAAPAAPQAAPTAAAVAPTTAAARVPTGTLKVALPSKLLSLDPGGPNSLEAPTLIACRAYCDTLVVKDPMTGEYRPSLATKWDNPDANTWLFTLRPGVMFHDGSMLTAADVKATLDRIVKLKGPIAPLWATLDGVETPDPMSVRLHFSAPLGTVLANAALLNILPASKVDTDGFFQKPVGTGPFRVVAYKADAELTLEANPTYWGGAPGVQSLRFIDIPETVARLTALDTGEIDYTFTIPPDQIAKVKANTNLIVAPTSSYTYYFVWMNAKRPPFTDVRVRQAMNYAIDADTMVKDLLGGIGKRAQAPIPSTVFGFAPQTPYAYDPAKAKQLLMDAGIAPGTEVTMIWTPSGGPQVREISQALISDWNAVGIKVKSGEAERAIWLDKLIKLDWDMDLQTNGVLTGDADFALRRLYTTAANRNGYGNPDLDKLLTDAAASVDQKKRADTYAQANKFIWDQAVGIYPFELLENYAYKKTLSGVVTVPNGIPSFAGITVGK